MIKTLYLEVNTFIFKIEVRSLRVNLSAALLPRSIMGEYSYPIIASRYISF